MKPKRKTKPAKPTLTPVEHAARLLTELTWTARRSLAIRRLHPDAVVRWRRAGKTLDGQPGVAVVVLRPDRPPELAGMTLAEVDRLAGMVSDADCTAELLRFVRPKPCA
jgi:hypothetical protein